MRKPSGLAALSGAAMYVSFIVFWLGGLRVPTCDIEYPLIVNLSGYCMLASASLCAVTSIITWLDSRSES